MAANIPFDSDNGTEETRQIPVASNQQSGPVALPETPSIGRARTERPVEPEHIYHAFNIRDVDEATIGNNELLFTLKEDGQLGIFYDRNVSTRIPTLIEMDANAVYNACVQTLTNVSERLLAIGKHMEPAPIPQTAETIAMQLSQGIMVMIYMKLRLTNYFDPRVMARFYKKPKVPVPFEVPRPYALAISQLGQIKASGLPTEEYFSPISSDTASANFCLPAGALWSPINYCRSVEYAKRIGIQFTTVDLSVKMGSTWWLYRPIQEQDVFALHCPLPEENFTRATACLHSLFCVNAAAGFFNPIFNLNALGDADYGTMLRTPPDRVDLSTYFAIEDAPEIVWKIT
uniref:Coat protein n=1 Tax=Pistacia cryptic virus TaxID=2794235 RepID=A0A7T0Q772_9VIRU|nr:coat protein [Pistacia cryptic virus]